jgi:hypothetical protein
MPVAISDRMFGRTLPGRYRVRPSREREGDWITQSLKLLGPLCPTDPAA